MKRWLIGILIAIVVLLALAVGAFEYVRRGDIPRNLVRDAIADRTGLNVQIDSLQIGWSGHTEVAGVELALPDAPEPFLRRADMHIDHTALLMLVLTRELHLDSMLLEGAELTLEQDDAGQWNLQRAAELFEANTPPAEKDGGRTTLPDISVPDLVVHVRDASGQTTTINPVVINGDQRGSTWHFDVDVASLGSLILKLEPDEPNLAHEVTFDIERPDEGDILAPWVPQDIRPLRLRGAWRGELAESGVTGELDLQQLRVRTTTVDGVTRISTKGAVATIEPRRLNIQDDALPRPVRLTGGTVRIDAPLVDLDNLRAQFATGSIVVNGDADWEHQLGNLLIEWKQIRYPDPFTHSGSLEAHVLSQPDGAVRIETDLKTAGHAPGTQWDIAMDVFAQGPSWHRWRGSVSFPQLALTYDNREIALPGLSMQMAMNDMLLEFEKLTVPQQTGLSAQGSVNLANATWNVQGLIRDLQLQGQGLPTISAQFDASGDQAQVNVKELAVQSRDFTAQASGSYDPSLQTPLDAQVNLTYVRRLPEAAAPAPAPAARRAVPPAGAAEKAAHPAVAGAADAEEEAAPKAPQLDLGGEFRFDVATRGSLDPLNLDIMGNLDGSNLVTSTGARLQPVSTALDVDLTDQAAEFRTGDFQLLGGEWTIHGQATFGDKGIAEIVASVDGLPLNQLNPLLPQADLPGGVLGAQVRLRLPNLEADQLQASGSFELQQIADVPTNPDRVTGDFAFEGETVSLSSLRVEKGSGLIEGAVTYDMGVRPAVSLDVTVSEYPVKVPVGDLQTHLSGSGDMAVDLSAVEAEGKLDLKGPVVDGSGRQVGQFDLAGSALQREWTVIRLNADFLDAQLKGKGKLNLDEPYKSTAEADWENLQLEQFVELYPVLEGLAGKTSGMLRLGPADEPRPLEPTRLNVLVRVEDGRFNRLKFDDLSAVAYLGPERIVLDKSRFEVANGILKIWGTRRTRDNASFVQLDVDAKRLDLTELRRAYDPEAEPLIGRLTVTGQAAGPLTADMINDVRRWYGQGKLTVTQADLAGSDVIGALYSLLSLNFGGSNADGQGSADLRLEDGQLIIQNAHYFNRGVEFGGQFTVANVVQTTESALSGRAGASLQPLRGLPLPGAKDFSAILGDLQGEIAAVRVGGTVGEPDVEPASFENLTGSFLQALFGDD